MPGLDRVSDETEVNDYQSEPVLDRIPQFPGG
jgi:hypothetical protein